MPSALFALLDDVAALTKVAAASIDDIGAAAGRASAKAAGVVIDDAAVTPRYVTGFSPARELPIIWAIAKGSLRNKLLIILPAALLLSVFAPWAVTPLLMLGGTYLCYEGAEKIIHSLMHRAAPAAEVAAAAMDPDHEARMVSGAVRTDFILSAEIMAIALAEVIDESLGSRAAILAVVAIGITVMVYGVVALIVKLDDIGLNLARRGSAAARLVGRGLLIAMPKILVALSVIGTAAMLWVGGQIVLHGLHELHLWGLGEWLHHGAAVLTHGLAVGAAAAEWLINALGAGVFGLALGALVVGATGLVRRLRGQAKSA